MESKNKANGTAIILLAFSFLATVAGAFSLEQLAPHLNKWQVGGYAVVAGVFIALAAVIIAQILAFFRAE